MKDPSPRQADVLQFIARYHTNSRGYSPSIREIRAGAGFSSASEVQRIVVALERKGLIRRNPRRHRSIKILCEVPGWPTDGPHMGRDFIPIGKCSERPER